MTTSKTARDLAGWNHELARQIDAALEDRYRRGYERGWKAALTRLHGVLDDWSVDRWSISDYERVSE